MKVTSRNDMAQNKHIKKNHFLLSSCALISKDYKANQVLRVNSKVGMQTFFANPQFLGLISLSQDHKFLRRAGSQIRNFLGLGRESQIGEFFWCSTPLIVNQQIFHHRTARIKHLCSKVRSLFGHFMAKLAKKYGRRLVRWNSLYKIWIRLKICKSQKRLGPQIHRHLWQICKSNKFVKSVNLQICDLRNLFANHPLFHGFVSISADGSWVNENIGEWSVIVYLRQWSYRPICLHRYNSES